MDLYNDVLVLGVAYTPAYEDGETTLFKYSEMTPAFAESLRGLPVYVEHDTRIQIGTVHSAYINDSLQAVALLHIHGNTMVCDRLPAFLDRDPRTGRAFYNAFSLGNELLLWRNPDTDAVEVMSNTPSEVSVCVDGDRPQTDILDYWVVPTTCDVAAWVEAHKLEYYRGRPPAYKVRA